MLCANVLPNCVGCSSETVCTNCVSGFSLDSISQRCVCAVGIEVTGTCTTIVGCISSHYINSVLKCLACDASRNFYYSNYNCPCVIGYVLQPNANTCTAVCGDGRKVSVEECDDGNKENNDGCSSLCKI